MTKATKKKSKRSTKSKVAKKSNKKPVRKSAKKKPVRSTGAKSGYESNKPEAEKAKPGRPVGSRTEKRVATARKSKCVNPRCQSTQRHGYSNVRKIAINGTDPVFGEYTHIVFRVTKCKKCNQSRTDRSFENNK